MMLFQPGVPREVQETIQAIEAQLWVACSGASDSVKVMQTETGIKDKIAQFWIEKALAKASELKQERLSNPETRDLRLNDRKCTGATRKAINEEIIVAIQREIFDWLVQQPPHNYNNLCADSRMF